MGADEQAGGGHAEGECRGSIDGATGERIALGVAEANECGYCLSAHSYLGANVAKLDDGGIERARRFDSSDPKAAAILAFAEAVVASKGGVSDADIRPLAPQA